MPSEMHESFQTSDSKLTEKRDTVIECLIKLDSWE